MRALLLLLLTLHLPLPGATFLAPEESKTLFKRDLLPVDTDTMRALSAHLTTLARRETGDDAAQLRASAQLLAIAIRLAPANRPARELARRLAEGQPAGPGNGDLDLALRQTWRVVDWLLQPASGAEGQRLGHQLLDALHLIDPRDSNSKLHDADGEAARWQGVVAPVARFERADPEPDASKPEQAPKPAPPPPPPIKRPPLLLRKASVQTPLFFYDSDLRIHLRLTSLNMDLIDREDPALLTFAFDPEFKSPLLETARDRVRRSLERTWPVLPIESVAILSAGGEHYASRNETALSGPASLLLHSALAGRELRDDVVFLGDVQRDGSLKRPRWSWDYLRAVRASKTGGRLLVPPDTQADLRAMLALEDPSFFVKWEVLVVTSMDAAFSLAYTGGDPEGLTETAPLFAEIQELHTKGKDVGQLCVNSKVRDRLATVLSRAPFHFSAAMLLTQGSAQKRPTRTERAVTARMLRSGVEPLSYLTRASLQNLSVNRLVRSATTAAAEIGRYKSFFRPEDLDLHKEAAALVHLADRLARGKRDGVRNSKGEIVYARRTLTSYHSQLQADFSAFLKKIAPFTGEKVPNPAPTGKIAP